MELTVVQVAVEVMVAQFLLVVQVAELAMHQFQVVLELLDKDMLVEQRHHNTVRMLVQAVVELAE